MKVLVAMPVYEEHINIIKSAAPDYDFEILEPFTNPSREQVDSADIILGNVKPEYINGSDKIKWLQTASAGVEPYIAPGVLGKNTILTNATGAYGLAIAEHMLGMHLEIIKKLSGYRDLQRENKWKTLGKVKSIHGATIVVLGMGDIGGEYAKRCKALGAYIIGVRRSPRQKPDYADEVCLTADLDKVLPRADVLAISLPGTAETKGLIGKEKISLMKEGSIILNVGRGNIIDTEALCDALESGRLMGAGLDVTDPEPLPEGHRLWNLPTSVITPHISGYYNLQYTHDKIVEITAENLRCFREGKPMRNIIDFSAGYRKL